MVLPLFLTATLGAVGIGTGAYIAGSGVQKASSGIMWIALAVVAIYLITRVGK